MTDQPPMDVESHRTALRRVAWMRVPVATYLTVTLALPLVGGKPGPGFAFHALWVLGLCACVVVLAATFAEATNRVRTRTWQGGNRLNHSNVQPRGEKPCEP